MRYFKSFLDFSQHNSPRELTLTEIFLQSPGEGNTLLLNTFSFCQHQLQQLFVPPNQKQGYLSSSINKQTRTMLATHSKNRKLNRSSAASLEKHRFPPALLTDAEVKVFVHSWDSGEQTDCASQCVCKCERVCLRVYVSLMPHQRAELTFLGHWLQTENSGDRVEVSSLMVQHRWEKMKLSVDCTYAKWVLHSSTASELNNKLHLYRK